MADKRTEEEWERELLKSDTEEAMQIDSDFVHVEKPMEENSSPHLPRDRSEDRKSISSIEIISDDEDCIMISQADLEESLHKEIELNMKDEPMPDKQEEQRKLEEERRKQERKAERQKRTEERIRAERQKREEKKREEEERRKKGKKGSPGNQQNRKSRSDQEESPSGRKGSAGQRGQHPTAERFSPPIPDKDDPDYWQSFQTPEQKWEDDWKRYRTASSPSDVFYPLWEHKEVLGEFLEENPFMAAVFSECHERLVRSICRRPCKFHGPFCIGKIEKKRLPSPVGSQGRILKAPQTATKGSQTEERDMEKITIDCETQTPRWSTNSRASQTEIITKIDASSQANNTPLLKNQQSQTEAELEIPTSKKSRPEPEAQTAGPSRENNLVEAAPRRTEREAKGRTISVDGMKVEILPRLPG